MKISQLLTAGRPLFSFEFFPPKDDPSAADLMAVIRDLKQLQPDFVSVTYGAGGSTRRKTLELVTRIKRDIGIEPVAHLTCVGHSKTEIRDILQEFTDNGIENILALRGDPPRGQTAFVSHPDGFRHANELAETVARKGFCFGVAGYPEKHPEAPTMEEDLRHLKRKVDTGASFITTQLFFHNTRYFDFVSRARAIGIQIPILAGIMPITNYSQIQRFTQLCGATMPVSLTEELQPVQEDLNAVSRIGIRYAAQQCRELLQKGAPGIHFYTLNKSRSTREILGHLRGLRDQGTSSLLRDI
ncbi:MAG: methylenetetrahydrofolate reductase [NAD(P)H] [Elusimicrobiota bacterium]|jgi:methylenetetrahydrofolate reductase (NADPH)